MVAAKMKRPRWRLEEERVSSVQRGYPDLAWEASREGWEGEEVAWVRLTLRND